MKIKFTLELLCLVGITLVSHHSLGSDTIVNSYTKSGLPMAGTIGRIVSVTDASRGLWMDTGTQWLSINGKIFDVTAFGARGDGSTDDSSSINAAVSAASSAGGGMVFFPAGTYIVSSAIPMRSYVQYAGVGWASIIKSKSTSLDNIMGEAYPANPTTAVIIRDLQLDGNKSAVTAQGDDAYQNAIRWDQVSFSRINNVYVHDTVFNGISNYNQSNDNIIERNLLTSIGKPGAVGTMSGIFMEFGNYRTKILNNWVVGALTYGIHEGGDSANANNYDNIIQGNLISNTTSDGIRIGFDIGSASDFGTKAINNQIFNCGANAAGIRVFFAGGSGYINSTLIEGNSVENCPHGILLQGSRVTLAQVINNQVKNNTTTGIGVTSTDTIVANNIALGQPTNFSDGGTRTVTGGNIVDTSTGQFLVGGSLNIGNGTAIKKHLSSATTWDPASITTSTGTSTTLTVSGAAVGDTVAVGFSNAVPARAILSGSVTSAGTVTVTLMNFTGASLNLASGSLRADVWQH